MFVAVVTKSAWHAVGERIGSLLVFVNRTCSERGEVKLDLARLAARSRSSSSICSPIGATSTG